MNNFVKQPFGGCVYCGKGFNVTDTIEGNETSSWHPRCSDMAPINPEDTQSPANPSPELPLTGYVIDNSIRSKLERIVQDDLRTYKNKMKALNKLDDLVRSAVTQARIDELTMAVQQYIFTTKNSPENFSEYATCRLRELEKGTE